MSIQEINTIMSRIKVATPDSPIAVFKNNKNQLNATYGNTVMSVHAIKKGFLRFYDESTVRSQKHEYVGSYDCYMDMTDVKKELTGVMNNDN